MTRVAELDALIAEEPSVKAELARARLAYGELVERADQLGIETERARAAHEDRSAWSAFRGLFFGKRPIEREEELRRKDAELARANADVAAGVETERRLGARLEAISAARAELAAIAEAHVANLRDDPGPDGQAYRALDADLAEIDGTTVQLRDGLAACERAVAAAESVGDAHTQLVETPPRHHGGGLVGLALELVVEDEAAPRAAARARLGETVDDLGLALEELIDALGSFTDQLAAVVQRLGGVLRQPRVDPPEASLMVRARREISADLDRAMSVLQNRSTELTQVRQRIEARKRDLTSRAIRR
jgi:hypothetical protein